MPDPQTHDRSDLIQPNAENRYTVTTADLPLSCPMPGMYLWNSHPKVYLPVHETGEEKCMYCGAVYVLEGAEAGGLEATRRGRRQEAS
jgi:uncharacterized Zn-finger protein